MTEKITKIRKPEIPELPKSPGVYLFYDKKGKILYIGKAANIRERVKNHFKTPGFRDNLFLDKIEKIGYKKTDSEIEALLKEAELIKKEQPKFNILWRDDKNYFYLGITKEEFSYFIMMFGDSEKEIQEDLETITKIFGGNLILV